jgi:hypothetical protein
VNPADFPLGSIESRVAARAVAESLEPSTFHCAACFLTVAVGSNSQDFVPKDSMEKGPDGWIWRCPKHRDPSREATVQALMKSGLLKP